MLDGELICVGLFGSRETLIKKLHGDDQIFWKGAR
jgi:hypothetical protein